MSYIKDVVCCPENHLALLISLAVMAPGVWFVIYDAGWDGWRKVRPLRSFASFYWDVLLAIAYTWRVVLGIVLGVAVSYLLFVTRQSWCRSDGKCSAVSSSQPAPRSKPVLEPCDLVFERKERKICLKEEVSR